MTASGSKVGDRLAERPAPELVEHLYTPGPADVFEQQFDYMSDVNRAHVVMLARQGIITHEVAQQLLNALEDIAGQGADGLGFDPEREDLFFNYEHAVIIRTSLEVGGQLHTARSRNDLGATIVRMRTRSKLLELLAEALALRTVMLDLAREHPDTVFPGYTHLQPAQPITFAHYLTAVESALGRDSERLLAALERTNLSSLGAAAFAGTSHPIDRELAARLLGFAGVVVNTIDAVASRDYLLEALAAGTLLAGTLNRLAQDLYVWYSHEFSLIDFRDRVSGTSSIMPQKKNPVLLENIKGRTAHQLGALTSAIAGIRNSHFTNVMDANRIGFNPSWQALEELRVSLILTRLALENITVNRDRALARSSRDFSTVTQLADDLVSEFGLSFRQAHELIGGVVRQVIENEGDASDISGPLIGRVARDMFNIDIQPSPEMLSHALDPAESVRRRTHLGGTSPDSFSQMLAVSEAQIDTHRSWTAEVRDLIAAAGQRLQEEVQHLLNAAPGR